MSMPKSKRERLFYCCFMNGELGLRGRYSVCAVDNTAAMNRTWFTENVQTDCGVHQASYSVDTGLGLKRPRVKLTPRLLSVPTLGISGTVLPLRHMLSWHVQGQIYLNVQYFYPNLWTSVSVKALFSLSPKFDFALRLCLPLHFISSRILELYLLRYCGALVLTAKLIVRNVFSRLTSKRHSANSCLASVCLCSNGND